MGVERNRYADLLRVGAIGLVVAGHWLVTAITYKNGQLSGIDALAAISWGRWLTWLFQVMPVFFVVGGYANATSWTAHRARGGTWATWLRSRALRLLTPTTLYVAVAVLAVLAARAAGVSRSEIGEAAWFVGLQLWFLPVYLLLVLLTPALLALHARLGVGAPLVMVAGVVVVDVGMIGGHLPVIGFANYLLGWGAIFLLGFAWRDGWLAGRANRYVLGIIGVLALAALLAFGPFPVDMIGVSSERVQNANPPSVALCAFAAAQTGLLLAVEGAGQRLLARTRAWRLVSRLNETTMTVYLWHMLPVVLVAVIIYPAGLMPQPGVGSWQWWALRPAWIALLGLVLVPLVVLVRRLELALDRTARVGWRGIRRQSAVGGGRWLPWLVAAGVGADVFALIKITLTGFAPGGTPSLPVLSLFFGGLILVISSGYPVPTILVARRTSP
ncbi:MAG TPA: acyltransferase [Streptosporangiaceae bacterium]|nr:acyltransferase [Streptosporangiaceae bacterium]